jgi:hypothetical protein
MAKQKIPEAVQKQFDKSHFQIDSAVFFSWMGYKQVGYVRRFKKVGWGIQYTVEAVGGVKYPCGIEIKGQKTQYNTGCIYLEETRSIGQESLVKRFQNEARPRRVTTVPLVITRTKDEGISSNKLLGTDNVDAVRTDANSRPTRNSTKMDAKLSINGDSNHNPKKRRVSKNTELDTAIQKQRDFLSGFVKKD